MISMQAIKYLRSINNEDFEYAINECSACYDSVLNMNYKGQNIEMDCNLHAISGRHIKAFMDMVDEMERK